MSKYNYPYSSYYPPRATWRNRFYYLWTKIKTTLVLNKLSAPALNLYPMILSVLLPGFSYIYAGKKTIGRTVLYVYIISAVFFLIFIGRPPGNLAFALLIFLHTSSIVYAQMSAMAHYSIMRRALFGGAVAIFGLLIYYQIISTFITKNLFRPFTQNNTVLVVSKLSRLSDVNRGDYVAYKFNNYYYTGIAVHKYSSLDRVIAIGGDHIKFTPTAVLVNGEVIQRFDYFPSSGEIILPEKCLFVVPNWHISNNNPNIDNIRKIISQLCIVDEGKFIGKAPRRWLGVRQYY